VIMHDSRAAEAANSETVVQPHRCTALRSHLDPAPAWFAPWTRLARLTVLPIGLYLNLRGVPCFPREPSHSYPNPHGESLTLVRGSTPDSSGSCRRISWAAVQAAGHDLAARQVLPHGHQLVPDIVHQHAFCCTTQSDRTPITSLSRPLSGPAQAAR